MDQVKTDGKKNTSARLERRKKWWAEKKANSRVTRARATEGEPASPSQVTSESATVSSHGFTSTHSPSVPFTSSKSKQKHVKNDITGFKDHGKSAKTSKPKSKHSANKTKSKEASLSDVVKPNHATPEKAPLPEVTVVRSFNTAETEMTPSVHSPKKYVLFVGNLPYSVTKEQVEEHFKRTGGVKAVRIPREKGTEKCKGFAYIEFNSHISHRIALRLHNTTLGGRKINVEFTSAGGKNEMRLQKLRSKNEKLCKFKMPFDT